MSGEQLELLFDAAAAGAETAPRGALVVHFQPHPQRREAADGAPARESVPIPARCPATGGRTCYRVGCHHYRPAGDGLAGHAARRFAIACAGSIRGTVLGGNPWSGPFLFVWGYTIVYPLRHGDAPPETVRLLHRCAAGSGLNPAAPGPNRRDPPEDRP